MNGISGRCLGSLYCGAIGDAYGYPIEFMDLEDIESEYGPDGLGYPLEIDGKLRISDDTQMTIMTAYGLIDCEDGDTIGSIHKAYMSWAKAQVTWDYEYVEGDLEILRNECISKHRAPGRTCITELTGYDTPGTRAAPRNDSKGCGGIMRIAPVAFYDKSRGVCLEEAVMHAADIAAITHGHPLGYIPAGMETSMLYHIIDGDGLEDAVRKSMEEIEGIFDEKGDVDYLLSLMNDAFCLSEGDLPDKDAMSRLGEGWVAEETLAMAVLACLRHPDDPLKALKMSVNIDGDSDSVGAVAGNIIGAMVGFDGVHEVFKGSKLEGFDLIQEYAGRIMLR